jgi:hypothetical protein
MEKRTLTPRNVVDVQGNLYYDEKSRAWSIIRLKSELVKEFPQLKEKRSKFSYQLAYYRTIEELEKTIKELKRKKEEVLPVLMFLYKEY